MWNQKRYIYSLYWGIWDLNSLTLNRSQYDYSLSDQRKECNAEVCRSLGLCLFFCVIQIYTIFFFFSKCCFTPHFCVKIYIYIFFLLLKKSIYSYMFAYVKYNILILVSAFYITGQRKNKNMEQSVNNLLRNLWMVCYFLCKMLQLSFCSSNLWQSVIIQNGYLTVW